MPLGLALGLAFGTGAPVPVEPTTLTVPAADLLEQRRQAGQAAAPPQQYQLVLPVNPPQANPNSTIGAPLPNANPTPNPNGNGGGN